MTVFKTFLKILNKYKVTVIMYTVFLVLFGAFNMNATEQSVNFVSVKPKIAIVNQGEEVGITKDFIDYLKKNSDVVKLKNSESARRDALFYRDVNFIVIFSPDFRKDFLNGKEPKIQVKSTKDYPAMMAERLVTRYIKVARTYQTSFDREEEILKKVNETLSSEVSVTMTSSLRQDDLQKATFYFNFMNYCMLAGCVYVISFILSSFQSTPILKRTMISSMNYKTYNRELLLSNSLFTILLWGFYILLSFILIGDIMFTMHGLFYIFNSFLFAICTLVIAFLVGSIGKSKDAINGIVNVIALGTSFLCGAFVPMEYLPKFVLSVAHLLPSYYFILNNELISKLETFNFESLKPIFINQFILIGFLLMFVFVINKISKKKRKIG